MRASARYKSPFHFVLYCVLASLLPAPSYAESFGYAQDKPFGYAQDKPFGYAQDKPFGYAQDKPFGYAQDKPGVVVKNTEIRLQNNHYILSADMEYRLSAKAKDALQNGVPLFWDIHIKILQHRDYFWDKTLANAAIRYRLQYHALLNMYRVKNEGSGELYNFSTLSAALALMSTLRDFDLMDKRFIVSGQHYGVGIKVTLDRDALPLPLRPVAYTNRQWYLSSDWTLWPLIQ